MGNHNSNFPSNQLRDLDGKNFTGQTVRCLVELTAGGKPCNPQELHQRIDDYFRFCAEHDLRPGIEQICLAIGCDRSTLWRWATRNDGWGEEARRAKALINAFLEAAHLSGKLNPASAIFLLKNWAGYKDLASPEPIRECEIEVSREEIQARIEMWKDAPHSVDELPD